LHEVQTIAVGTLAEDQVRRVSHLLNLLERGLRLRIVYALDFSADSFQSGPFIHRAKWGGESLMSRALTFTSHLLRSAPCNLLCRRQPPSHRNGALLGDRTQ
jgi:hypothetical protein